MGLPNTCKVKALMFGNQEVNEVDKPWQNPQPTKSG
jgi:hypothetical protein